jgi:hypothetical protein
MKKLIILLLVILGLAAIGYYNWNRKTESLQNAKVDIAMPSVQLFAAFEQDEGAANKLYLNKVLEVKGVVREVHKEANGGVVITLEGSDMFGVICRMESGFKMEESDLTGKVVAIKGMCTGMLMDVVMVQCVFSK